MSPYISQDSKDKTKSKYNLYAVILHSGDSATAGHYISYIKKGAKWYKCNDSNISTINEDEYDKQEDFQPYIIFYKRKN